MVVPHRIAPIVVDESKRKARIWRCIEDSLLLQPVDRGCYEAVWNERKGRMAGDWLCLFGVLYGAQYPEEPYISPRYTH